MKYQLIFQFDVHGVADFDRLVQLERELTRLISSSCVVDGHDCGSGEFNMFLLTDDPLRTFEHIISVAGNRLFQEKVRAAYRAVDQDLYSVLWPPGQNGFRVL